MRIKLTRSYTGPLINALPAGEYDANDARLKGRAQYLVNIGAAVEVDADKPKAKKGGAK